MSHPTWVRGLKPHLRQGGCLINLVAPYVGAWIETRPRWLEFIIPVSHPTWVRGLKHFLMAYSFPFLFVAPYVGAWIETYRFKF